MVEEICLGSSPIPGYEFCPLKGDRGERASIPLWLRLIVSSVETRISPFDARVFSEELGACDLTTMTLAMRLNAIRKRLSWECLWTQAAFLRAG